MGRPTDSERGLGTTLPPPDSQPGATWHELTGGLSASPLQIRITDTLKLQNTELKARARDDAAKGLPFLTLVNRYRWKSDEDRWVYTRYFLTYQYPGQDHAVVFRMVELEREFQADLARQEKQAAIYRVRSLAQHQPMNPLENFEPGRIEMSLDRMRRDPLWVDRDIAEARYVRAGPDSHWLNLIYGDGTILTIPIAPVTPVHLQPLPESDAFPPFFRRHKRTGRLIPFQISYGEFKLLPAGAPIEEALGAVAPRFDPVLTPHVMSNLKIAKLDIRAGELWIGAQAFGTAGTASGLAQAGSRLVTGTGKAALTSGPGVIARTGALARAASLEVRAAVRDYGVSKAAAAYLGRSAWTFYLKNAVAINIGGVTVVDIAITLGGGDMGPLSPGDALTMALQDEKAIWRIYETKIAPRGVEKTAQTVRVEITNTKLATADEADKYFDSGKMIHHVPQEKPSAAPKVKDVRDDGKVAAKAIDDTSATKVARATDNNGVNEPMGKYGRKVGDKWYKAPGPAKAVLPSSNINLLELLSDSEVEALVQNGFKRDALEKLRRAQIGELERMGLVTARAKDLEALRKLETKISQAAAAQQDKTLASLRKEQAQILERIAAFGKANWSLFKKLQASARSRGGVVKDFINEFWERPGFQEIVLNWAKGGISQRGTNFVMKYSLAKFKGRAIRFEWPVGATRMRGGAEGSGPARYVDIVVDGGTQIRPGEALRIELKSWSDRYLRRLLADYEYQEAKVAQLEETIAGMQKEIARLKEDTAKNAKEIAKLQKAVDEKKAKELQPLRERLAARKQQLARDTAFFTTDNIRWVFNSDLTSEAEVIKTFVELINKDDFLRKHWGGTKPEIEATLKRVVEMFNPGV